VSNESRPGAPPASVLHPDELLRLRLLRALEEVGDCLRSLSWVLIQGIREDNAAHRGSIAVGLERAAVLCRGGPYNFAAADPPPAPKTENQAPPGDFAALAAPVVPVSPAEALARAGIASAPKTEN
jgi:hypothetical protein